MRILLISEYFPTSKKLDFTGGVEARTFFVAKYLAKKHRVFVLTSRLKETKAKEIIEGINIIRCGRERDYSQKAIWPRLQFMMAVYKIGTGLKADMIEGSGFFSLLPAYIIGRKLHVQAAAWYPDTIQGSFGANFGFFWRYLLTLFERILLNLSWDRIITISNSVRKKLVKLGIKKEKIQVIYCGVDVDLIKTVKVRKEKWSTVCYAGRLVKYKRLDDLIEATIRIKRVIPNVQVKIIGQGLDRERLRQMVKEKNLEKNINFLGYIKSYYQMLAQIKSVHIFCLPSLVEGFGIILLEASCLGVPYVASDIPVLREVTKDGQGGLLFRAKNVNDLAEKLRRLLTDENLRQKKSQEAVRLASGYSWEKIAEETERVYRQIQNSK